MGYARHVGRVGALAVALGVGAAVATAPGIASAEPSDAGSVSSAPADSSPTSASSPSAGTSLPSDSGDADAISPSPAPPASGGSGQATAVGGSADGPSSAADEQAEPGDDAADLLEHIAADGKATDAAATTPARLPDVDEPSGKPADVSIAPTVAARQAAVRPAGRSATRAPAVADSPAQVEAPATVGAGHTSSRAQAASAVIPAPTITPVAASDVAAVRPAVAVPTPVPPLSAMPPLTRTVVDAVSQLVAALGPMLSPMSPVGPVQSPLIWTVLGWVRRELQQSFFPQPSRANRPPTAVNDTTATAEDKPVSIAVLANDTDPDRDRLTVSALGTPAHGTVSQNGNIVTYTPAADYNGTDAFTYTVSDGKAKATATVNVKVNPVNDPPKAVNDTASTAEDTPIGITVLANDTDPDHDTLTVTTVATPTHGTATITGNTITYTPTADYNGTDAFSYTISDGKLTSTASVAVTVTPVNDPPKAVDDTLTIAEDIIVVIAPNTLLANDIDVDGDALTITSVQDGVNGRANLVGSYVVFTPPFNSNGPAQFTYTISDGKLTSTGTVHVTITPVNDAPTAVNDAASARSGVPVDIAVLGNDTDPDRDLLTVAVGTPGHGTATVNNGVVNYVSARDFIGSDSFSYTITDGHGGTSSATVTVSVTVDHPPVTIRDLATTPQGTPVTVAVLANDYDPDGDPLTALPGFTTTAHGSVTFNGQMATYTPQAGFVGEDGFLYGASDGIWGTKGFVVVTVTESANVAPVAVDDTVTTREDHPVTIDVLSNDINPDGPLQVAQVGTPAHGTVTLPIAADSSLNPITYVPYAGFSGVDSFSYTITDGAATSTATVTVTVAPNVPPVGVEDTATTRQNTPVAIDVVANDTDPSGDELFVGSYQVYSDWGGTVAMDPETGFLVYTPAAGFVGVDSFLYSVTDWTFYSADTTVTITVSADEQPAGNETAT